MADTTTNLGLTKPAQTDFYNVEVFNTNADLIDAAVAAAKTTAEEALPSESYTADDVLSKIKTVDGSGSGLDADLFKGNSVIPIANGGTGATSLLNFVAKKTVIDSSVNVDDIIENGVYQVAGTANMPTNAYGILLVMNYSNYAFQIYRSVTVTGAYSVWVRSSSSAGTSWSDWHNMVTTYNLATKVQSLLTGGEVSVIKSVQRGTVQESNSTSTTTITISSVTPSKCIVLINGSSYNYITQTNNVAYAYAYNSDFYISEFTSTSITLSHSVSYSSAAKATISWQIIEYY